MIANITTMIIISVDSFMHSFFRTKIGMGVFVAKAGPNRIMLHQAANDGFRGVYMMCFDGPDRYKGRKARYE